MDFGFKKGAIMPSFTLQESIAEMSYKPVLSAESAECRVPGEADCLLPGFVPAGDYKAIVTDTEPFTAKTGTPALFVHFTIIEGRYAQRSVTKKLWLTTKAMPRTKRDLQKLGITAWEQAYYPPPWGILCKVTVKNECWHNERRNTDQWNAIVEDFNVVGLWDPEPCPLPLAEDGTQAGDLGGEAPDGAMLCKLGIRSVLSPYSAGLGNFKPVGYSRNAAVAQFVNAERAFTAYAACDQRVENDSKVELSTFQFTEDLRTRWKEIRCFEGFAGICWAPWIWFGIRNRKLLSQLKDARQLVAHMSQRYGLNDDSLLVFYAGDKGFEIGMPTRLWSPEPSTAFNEIAQRFATTIAEAAGVEIDRGVFDRLGSHLPPNVKCHLTTSGTRYSRTIHKRRLNVAELMELSLTKIRLMAEKPAPFKVPEPESRCEQATSDWAAAMKANGVADLPQFKFDSLVNPGTIPWKLPRGPLLNGPVFQYRAGIWGQRPAYVIKLEAWWQNRAALGDKVDQLEPGGQCTYPQSHC
jgi:hypothetical protein